MCIQNSLICPKYRYDKETQFIININQLVSTSSTLLFPRYPDIAKFQLPHYFNFIYLFLKFYLFHCVGSSLSHTGFLQLWRVEATLPCSARVSHCCGFSCCGAWALGGQASVVVMHRLSCSVACRIFPDQGSNPCPLYWQADS